MKNYRFCELKVWQKAHKLVLGIYKLSKSFPEEEKYGLVSQMRRSAVSINANIAEGYMKGKNEFLRYLEIARGSLEETKYYFILSNDLGYCDDPQINALSELADEVGRMLFHLKRSLINQPQRTKITDN